MDFKKRKTIQLGSGLVLSVLIPRIAAASTILGVRVWPAEEYTRVTIETNDELKNSFQLVKDPERLVVDITNLRLDTKLKELIAKVQPNDPYIDKIRIGQNKPDVVRLVFDLKGEVLPQVFTLKPIGGYQYRLIFDLYPTHPVIKNDEANNKPLIVNKEDSSEKTQNTPIVDDNKKTQESASNTASKTSSANESSSIPTNDDNNEKVASFKNRIVVIDPGHGGEDPGAIGATGTQEKDVVLKIAKKLKRELDKLPHTKAILTRDGDFFVPLNMRVQKARDVNADLFISIHADAFVDSSAKGSSVFVLSKKGASSAAAKWLANKENDADLIGGANVKVRDLQLAKVLLDMSTTAQIQDSLKLGKYVLKEIGSINKLHKGEVEHAGFAVLKAPDIPSILVETAFISNPVEEAKLITVKHQEKVAQAISEGVQRFFKLQSSRGISSTD